MQVGHRYGAVAHRMYDVLLPTGAQPSVLIMEAAAYVR